METSDAFKRMLPYYWNTVKTTCKMALKNRQNKDLNDKWLLNEG